MTAYAAMHRLVSDGLGLGEEQVGKRVETTHFLERFRLQP